MLRAISTHLFRDSILGVAQLDQIERAGFDTVEIFCARQHFDYLSPNHVREIAGWFAGSPVKLHSLHSPLSRDPDGSSHHSVVSIAFTERKRRQDSMDEIKKVIEVAEKAPYQYLIVHLGLPGEEFDLQKFDAALTSLEHLRLFATQRGVKILVENIPNDLSSPRRLLQFFHHSQMRDIGVCFDSGHALLEGGVPEALDLLKGHIVSTHLHDNGGTKDEHRFPFEGKIEWESTIRSFHECAPNAPLLLEARRHGEEISAAIKKSAQIIDRFAGIVAAADSGQKGAHS